MSQPALIYAATRENFTPLVLESSRRGLVLVDFWAPWVGPSLRQREMLVALAVFDNLEKDDPRVKQYRTELFRLAY
jgi:thioredoxin-like negative regulator of GroEL